MEQELKKLLLNIAVKLNSYRKTLSDNDFTTFSNNIQSMSLDALYLYACKFLDLTFSNGLDKKVGWLRIRNDFDIIYRLILPMCLSAPQDRIKSINLVERYASELDFPTFLDGHIKNMHLNDGVIAKDLKFIIPSEEKEKLLQDLYERFSPGIYEYNGVHNNSDLTSDALALFDGGLNLHIFCYDLDNNGDFCQNTFLTVKGKKVKYQIKIDKKVLGLCFKQYKGKLKTESLEMMYIDCITNGKALDFIEAMTLRTRVDFGIINKIRSNTSVQQVNEEVKNDGLQKIS